MIFISYSRKDRSTVEEVCQSLRLGGFDVWIDTEHLDPIIDFQGLDSQIQAALSAAQAVVACVSEAMMADTGYVYLEHEIFRDRTKRDPRTVVPLLFDEGVLPERLLGCREAIRWRNGKGAPQLLAALNDITKSMGWIYRIKRFLKGNASPRNTLSTFGIQAKGPITITMTDIFENILGSCKRKWTKTYPRTPSLDELITDLQLDHPFAVYTDVERAAYFTSKLIDALLSPAIAELFRTLLLFLEPDFALGDALKRRLTKVGEGALLALRAQSVEPIRIEYRRDRAWHHFVFLIRPGAFATLRASLAKKHLSEITKIIQYLSFKAKDQQCVLGNLCVLDIFVALDDVGGATLEAALTYIPSSETSVRSTQPEQLNTVVLNNDLISVEAIQNLGVNILPGTTHRGMLVAKLYQAITGTQEG
jgi:hypothetical protein